jgi:hypothetical protein
LGAAVNECENVFAHHLLMTRSTLTPSIAMNETLKKPLTVVSIVLVAAFTIGAAVAERVEQRNFEDRFSMGEENLPVIVD